MNDRQALETRLLGCLLRAPQRATEALARVQLDEWSPQLHPLLESLSDAATANRFIDRKVLELRFPSLSRLMAEAVSSVPGAHGWEEYARDLARATRRDRMQRTLDLSRARLEGGDRLEDVCSELGDYLAAEDAVVSEKAPDFIVSSRQALEEWLNDEESDALTARTGFRLLDRLVSGYRPGELWVIGGRTGVGKSSLAKNLATNLSTRSDPVPTAFVSFEESRQEIIRGLVGARFGIAVQRPREEWCDRTFADLASFSTEISRWPISISSPSSSDVAIADAIARRSSEEGGKVLFVDHAQLIRCPSAAKHGRTSELMEITRTLKRSAMREQITIVLLSQLNRTSNGTPTLRDLKQSGSLEEDSDVVVLVDREGYESENPQHTEFDTFKVFVAKRRGPGRVGAVELSGTSSSGQMREQVR